MLYFTSDTHYNHGRRGDGTFNEERNILAYCKRPYQTIDEHNAALIKNWNERVNKDDMVIHLGDFALGPRSQYKDFYDQLNGEKVLVAGNHDPIKDHKKLGWSDITDQLYVVHGNMMFWCAHVPSDNSHDHVPDRELSRPKAISGYDIELCGHVHEQWKTNGTAINVGVDMWDYRPISADEIIAYYLSNVLVKNLLESQ